MDDANEDSGLRTDPIEILPLGAGQEVGRSCIILKLRGKTIMLDCGLHPALQGSASFPNFDEIDLASVDLCLITHFHVDHAAALPYLMNPQRTNFRAPVFMTHATKAVFRLAMEDCISTAPASHQPSVTREDVEATFPLIQSCSYHAQHNVDGIRFTPYYAGHVLGACMFLIEIDGLRVLYTGDFSHEPDRHLAGAECPPGRIDVVISESTFGTLTHPPRAAREAKLLQHILDVVSRGGKCLLPVNAMGATQEILLILEAAWQARKALQSVPIYFISGLGSKAASLYATYICAMNDDVRSTFALEQRNVFDFQFVTPIPSLDMLPDVSPCVVLAVPGMLQEGRYSPSRELFDRWASDRKNGCVIATYCVEGTLAKRLLTTQPMRTHTCADGRVVSLLMDVWGASFAAHADSNGVCSFLDQTGSRFVVLVHGERNNMEQLRTRLVHTIGRKRALQVFTPANCETVRLEVLPEVEAVVCGSIAESLLALKEESEAKGVEKGKKRGAGKRPRGEDAVLPIDAVLVQRSSHAAVASPDDIGYVASLARGCVTLSVTIPFLSSTALSTVRDAATSGAGGVDAVDGSGYGQVWRESALSKLPSVSAAIAAATATPDALLGVTLRSAFATLVKKFGRVREVHTIPDIAAVPFGDASAHVKIRTFSVGGVVTCVFVTGAASPAAVLDPPSGLGGSVAAALRGSVDAPRRPGGQSRAKVEAAAEAVRARIPPTDALLRVGAAADAAICAAYARGAALKGTGGGKGAMDDDDDFGIDDEGDGADVEGTGAKAEGVADEKDDDDELGIDDDDDEGLGDSEGDAAAPSAAPAAVSGVAQGEVDAEAAAAVAAAVGLPGADAAVAAAAAGGEGAAAAPTADEGGMDKKGKPAVVVSEAAAAAAAEKEAQKQLVAIAGSFPTPSHKGLDRSANLLRSATVSWESGPASDVVGEAVVSALFALVDVAEAEKAEKASQLQGEMERESRFRLRLLQRLLAQQQFDADASLDVAGETITFSVRGNAVTVTGPWPPGTVTCSDPQALASVRLSVLRAVLVVWPIVDVSADATACSGCFGSVAPPAAEK